MGNKLARKRQLVDERYTRPKGLDFRTDVDIKKLRKLILESKLAPCYPGDEECCCDLEECPICLLYYPSLNRSRCCTKSICTECFLQMKNPNSTRPTQCPFCKASNYAVEYRGVKTKEEKGIEQLEEQRVIEAKIRMRQRELQDEEERMRKRHELNRDDEFDIDLEDIVIMEAIWLSIEENIRHRNSENYPLTQSLAEMPADGGMTPGRDEEEWGVNYGSDVAEAETSYASSDAMEDAGEICTIPQQDEIRGSFRNIPEPIVPQSYEDQMMLAMAVSLAEGRSMTSGPGVSWQ